MDEKTIEVLKFYAVRSDSRAYKLLQSLGYSYKNGEWSKQTQSVKGE